MLEVPLEGGSISIGTSPLRGKARVRVTVGGRSFTLLASVAQLGELVEVSIARWHVLRRGAP